MGSVIVFRNVDASHVGLGKVPGFKSDLEKIEISGENVIYLNGGRTLQLSIDYLPYGVPESQKEVRWNVVSGEATINTKGLLTVNAGVNNTKIVVKAISTYNENIIATKEIIAVNLNAVSWYMNLTDEQLGGHGGGRGTYTQMTNISSVNSEQYAAVHNKKINIFKFNAVRGRRYEQNKSNAIIYILVISQSEKKVKKVFSKKIETFGIQSLVVDEFELTSDENIGIVSYDVNACYFQYPSSQTEDGAILGTMPAKTKGYSLAGIGLQSDIVPITWAYVGAVVNFIDGSTTSALGFDIGYIK